MHCLNDLSSLVNILPEEEQDKYVNPEKIQRRVYCELAFLEKIQFLFEKAVNPMEMSERDLQVKTLFDILVQFDLYLDVPKEKIDSLTNCSHKDVEGVYRILWAIVQRKIGNNKSVIIRGKDNFVSINSIDDKSKQEVLNALFMTVSEPDICEITSKNYGVTILQFDEQKQFVKPIRLLNNSWLEQQIEKSQKVTNNWSFLNNVSFLSNSLIIVDGYILRTEKSIRLNVLPILDKLLPKNNLRIPFNITFVVNDSLDDSELSINDARNLLASTIKQIRLDDFNVSINIYNMKGREHNRWVITNNQYIKCEAGFDLITEDNNTNRKYYTKSTNVHVSCIYSNPSDRKDYECLCKRIIGYQKNKNDWYDDADNRLLC